MWNVSEAFKRELRRAPQAACKVVMLDTEFDEVEEDTLFSTEQTNEITNFISDGNIDVDYSRGTRRTAELTLLNPTAEFTPATEDFEPMGPWVGKIYLNRVIRIYRGVYIAGTPSYVPVGTFMIDGAEVIVERNMSLVVLTLSDLWKKLAKSFAKTTRTWNINTPYGLIIREILEDTGSSFPLAPIIDDLSGRVTEDKKLSKKITMEEGDSRGDWLKERAVEWDLDVYFDPVGRFIMQDRKAARDKAVQWHFYASEDMTPVPGLPDDPFGNADNTGMLTNIRRSFNDDNVFNHVIVVGGGESPVRRERVDEDPRSKLNKDLIGDRVWLIKDDKIKNGTQADKALDRAWQLRFQISETLQADVICNPALEADDVIRITERVFAKVDGTYRLARFNVPLITSRQTIQSEAVLKESNF